MDEKRIGKVLDYFAKIGVLAFRVEEEGLKAVSYTHLGAHHGPYRKGDLHADRPR